MEQQTNEATEQECSKPRKHQSERAKAGKLQSSEAKKASHCREALRNLETSSILATQDSALVKREYGLD